MPASPIRTGKIFLFNVIFAGNCLLVFLLLAEQFVVVPKWLQVAGRMHPLILHFPLVLIIVAAFWEFFLMRRKDDAVLINIADGLLLVTAFSTMITAVFGLLLSREEGYDTDAITWHKWGGIFISLLVMAWYAGRHYLRENQLRLFSVSGLSLFALVITAHEGGSITHGENFLLAPVMKEKIQPTVALEDAVLYAHVIEPIIAAKCLSCHNSKKAKGELIMETAMAFFKGGKNGKLWDTTVADLGLLLRRVHLPMEDKKHMPPKGKLQLDDNEINLLSLWFRHGADTTSKLIDLKPTDSLRLLAAGKFSNSADLTYSFAAASEGTVQQLNNFYRLVTPIATGSPALEAGFYGASQFKPEALTELLKVKGQVVSLLLNKMPVTDKDLQVVSQFNELRNLNLSFTKITDAGLVSLQALQNLQYLSVSGTPVTAAGISKIAAMKSLKHLYCWSSTVTDADLVSLRKAHPNLNFENGFNGDTITIRLNAPIIENEETILVKSMPLKIKHFVKGAEIRYTVDGEEPDSLHALLFTPDAKIDEAFTLKAKAFKKGWLSSSTVSKVFYKKGFVPDSSKLVYASESGLKNKNAQLLFDSQKGDNDYRTELWMGFRKNPMDLTLHFDKARMVNSVTISSLVDIGSYIMPPVEIQVWGSAAGKALKQLGKIVPKQPVKDSLAYQTSFQLAIKPVELSSLRIVMKPLQALPKWHGGKGEKAWAFADEVFVR
jgi:uncharacterized membrane protein